MLAAVGAADLALERINEIVAALRERVEEARTDATDRVEETRGRIAKLQEDLPQVAEEFRGRLSGDELRKAAEGYRDQVTDLYNELIERGEAALERLRNQPGFEERRAQAEKAFSDAAELTQEALGNVATQTRPVAERAAKLIGRESEKKVAKKVPAKKSAKKATSAKKAAPAKKVTQK